MKVRTDYVSNSSSSSFVIANMEFFDHFAISKEDILDALVDAYGVDEYKSRKNDVLTMVKNHPDWFSKDLEYGHFGPIWVYDLSIKEEKKEAVARWGKLLKDWDANHCIRMPGGGRYSNGGKKTQVALDSISVNKFNKAMDYIADVYDIPRDELAFVSSGRSTKWCKRFVHTDEMDVKTGLYGHYEPIPDELVKVVREMRNISGMMTNLEALKCKAARFFVHADDNELCNGKIGEMGRDEDVWDANTKSYVKANGDWETESCTYERVCEVILKYLVKVGKARLDDPGFLKKMRSDENYLSNIDKEAGRIYNFWNGVEFTWEDLKHNTLTWRMHEG